MFEKFISGMYQQKSKNLTKTECLRIKYFDTQKSKYRIAVPDFYIPSLNKIVEIKSSYWYDKTNMNNKAEEYKKLGFKFELVLDGTPTQN